MVVVIVVVVFVIVVVIVVIIPRIVCVGVFVVPGIVVGFVSIPWREHVIVNVDSNEFTGSIERKRMSRNRRLHFKEMRGYIIKEDKEIVTGNAYEHLTYPETSIIKVAAETRNTKKRRGIFSLRSDGRMIAGMGIYFG